jgi:hypothetical protein
MDENRIAALEPESKSENEAESVTVKEWKSTIPLDSRNNEGIHFDPEARRKIEQEVAERATGELEWELDFRASLDDDAKRKAADLDRMVAAFGGFSRFDYANQERWAAEKILKLWREKAKRTGEICGVCLRKFAPDETIYLDRIVEHYTEDSYAPKVTYGPVGACCVTNKMKRASDAAAEAHEPCGFTWTYRDDYLGRTERTTMWSTPTICETCGRRMFVRSRRDFSWWRRHYFCSKRCESGHYNKLRHDRGEEARQKACPICGQEFTAKRSDAKTCSPACRQKMHRMWKSLEA